MLKRSDRFSREERGRKVVFFLFICIGCLVQPLSSAGQEVEKEGWPIPDLRGLMPYSMSIRQVDGVEKVTEIFETLNGGYVARISGNGKVYAYAVDRDQNPPIDYLILDPDGLGKFTLKFGPRDGYFIPEWVSEK